VEGSFVHIQIGTEYQERIEEFRARHRTGVLTLLFTDLVGSIEIKQRLGDVAAVELIHRHQSLARQVLASFREAEEISTAGDSFFIIFAKPSDAVRFALLLQHALRTAGHEAGVAVLMRIGIHMGEVFIEEESEGSLKRDVLGIQADAAARVMSLAGGGQVLLTRSVFDNARIFLKGEALAGLAPLSWLNHGLYSVKGIEEPLEICEVGEEGLAPLTTPGDSEKARRYMAPTAEPVLGWRPAVEQIVPGTQWVLEEKLGEGGFGEVWRARHRHTKQLRVFKFCFRADRLRSLKREMTLFTILRESLGQRPDIARLYGIQFDEAPYYLELEYTAGGNLGDWIERRGGFGDVPMNLRLEIVAQIAAALSAAHSAGVIHKDVKPSNVLIAERADGSVQARLTDFGIGTIFDKEVVERLGIPATGFTETVGHMTDLGSRTGTRLYMAPELIGGGPPSVQSDIYSLGVLLYQMIVGNFRQPLTVDWERHVRKRFLRQVLRRCFAGNPAERFGSAEQLARQLRDRSRRPTRRPVRYLLPLAAVLVLIGVAAGVIHMFSRSSLPPITSQQKTVADIDIAGLSPTPVGPAQPTKLAPSPEPKTAIPTPRQVLAQLEDNSTSYPALIALAETAIEQQDTTRALRLLYSCPKSCRNWEWGHLACRAIRFPDRVILEAEVIGTGFAAFSPDGRRIVTTHNDGNLRVWETETGKKILSFRAGGFAVAYGPNRRIAVVSHEDATVEILDAEYGITIRTLKGHTDKIVLCAAFSSDGRRIVTGGRDKTARIWDVATGREILTLKGHAGAVYSAAFNPTGDRVVTSALDGTARIWDSVTGRELITLQAADQTDPTGQVSSAAFSPDGRRVLTVAYGWKTTIWDAVSGEVVLSFDRSHPFAELGGGSPDGRRILAGAFDGTTQLWDTETGKEMILLKGHSTTNRAVFSPDGLRIATSGNDGVNTVWNALPWRDEDLPGDASMSYDVRARLYILEQKRGEKKTEVQSEKPGPP
jgi:serine/threonine protein kinase/class 3 adenylate cyclase/outer membrane protein assembly factor BamB